MGVTLKVGLKEERGLTGDPQKVLEIDSPSQRAYPDIIVVDGRVYSEMGWGSLKGEYLKLYVPAWTVRFEKGVQRGPMEGFAEEIPWSQQPPTPKPAAPTPPPTKTFTTKGRTVTKDEKASAILVKKAEKDFQSAQAAHVQREADLRKTMRRAPPPKKPAPSGPVPAWKKKLMKGKKK